MARSDDRKIRCAFCGRTQDQVDKLIAGNGAYICSDCVRLCMNIVDEDLPQRTDPGKSAPSAPSVDDLPKPAEIKKFLDEYIVGQETAKIALSVAVYIAFAALSLIPFAVEIKEAIVWKYSVSKI